MSQVQNSFLGGVPSSGPQALSTTIEIFPPAKTKVDLKHKFDVGLFMGCQAVYLDAIDSKGDISMVTSFGQRIVAKKGTQGYYPILEGANMEFTFTSTNETADKIAVFFLNQPIASGVWGDFVLTASSDRAGIVKIGNGINVDNNGVISVQDKIATAATLGSVKVGDGLNISSDGTLSINPSSGGDYTLPTASASVLGGVKVGNGLQIDASGKLSTTGGGSGGGGGITEIPVASEDTVGGFKFYNGVYGLSLTGTENDVLSLNSASKYEFGGIVLGEGLEINNQTGAVDVVVDGIGGGTNTQQKVVVFFDKQNGPSLSTDQIIETVSYDLATGIFTFKFLERAMVKMTVYSQAASPRGNTSLSLTNTIDRNGANFGKFSLTMPSYSKLATGNSLSTFIENADDVFSLSTATPSNDNAVYIWLEIEYLM